jgi:hypothetical protein
MSEQNARDLWDKIYKDARSMGYSIDASTHMADDSVAPVFPRWADPDRVHAEALYANADRADLDAWGRVLDRATVTVQRDGYETRTVSVDVLGRDVFGTLNAAARVASNEGPNWEPVAAVVIDHCPKCAGTHTRGYTYCDGLRATADTLSATGDPRA